MQKLRLEKNRNAARGLTGRNAGCTNKHCEMMCDDGTDNNNNEPELGPEARPRMSSSPGLEVPGELRVMEAPALGLSPAGPASSHGMAQWACCWGVGHGLTGLRG